MKPTGIYQGTLRYTWEDATLPPHHELQCEAVMEVDFTVTPGEEETRDTPGYPTEVEWENDRLMKIRVYGEPPEDYVDLDPKDYPAITKEFITYWRKRGPWDRLEEMALEQAAEACEPCE